MVHFHLFNHCCRVTLHPDSLDGVQLSLRRWNVAEGAHVKHLKMLFGS